MAKNDTKDNDKGYDRIMRELKKLKANPYVKVGLPAKQEKTNTQRGDGFTNLDIAAVNEFGNDTVPERPHIRPAFDNNKKNLQKLTDKLAGQIYDGGMTVERSLDILGLKMVANIQKLVRSGLEPPVQRGGTPLVDTGQYVNSFTYTKVMDKKKDR